MSQQPVPVHSQQPDLSAEAVEVSPAPPNPQPGTQNAQLPHPVPTGPDGQPLFAQARGESDRAFEAFRVYLELGPKRRYTAVGRKVGAGLRTVERWSRDFDWRGRLQTYNAQCADRFVETEAQLRREQWLEAAESDRSLRERQHALAQSLLLAAERFLESRADDLDQMSFADVCRVLETASRLGQAAAPETQAATEPDHSLRDQLSAVLEQAYGEVRAKRATANSPATSASASVKETQP